ncbi:hypothetical protein [Streptomyces lavendulae]|uniref:hypothetical protein n=1 Tax=Streptomyces lavendulae TaxID=1914 RepID=UPI00367F9DFB
MATHTYWLRSHGDKVRTAPSNPPRIVLVSCTQAPVPIDPAALLDLFEQAWNTAPPGKPLEVREGEALLAQATIGLPVAGIGVLWWIGVTPTARGGAWAWRCSVPPWTC